MPENTKNKTLHSESGFSCSRPRSYAQAS